MHHFPYRFLDFISGKLFLSVFGPYIAISMTSTYLESFMEVFCFKLLQYEIMGISPYLYTSLFYDFPCDAGGGHPPFPNGKSVKILNSGPVATHSQKHSHTHTGDPIAIPCGGICV